jgi:hypothetical protein
MCSHLRRLWRNLLWPQVLLALCLSTAVSPAGGDVVFISSPANVSPAERLAAEDLASCLGSIYPRTRFIVAPGPPASACAILVGSDLSVRSLLPEADLSKPESFAVRRVNREGQRLGVIAGADTRGTVYGVYALLEKLGCGFYLSYDTLPPARTEPFSLDLWELLSAPVVRDRIVFSWHNFLSGCSTWNLPDWNSWTARCLKQGYNGIMVHAYGNNPMFSFSFNGRTKPVGYLSTTRKGRDWSTMHVNDVRRIFGGELFDEAVFGAAAALVPDDERITSTRQLMQRAFAFAQLRGIEVYFAADIDTVSANPQEVIGTLPAEARFPVQAQAVEWMGQKAGRIWLANPDSPDGYRYYKAQAAALMGAYPQISCFVAWFRQGGTPWMELKVSEMPSRWQREWAAEVARDPQAEKLWHAPQMFAIGKILRAFDHAFRELGQERLQLAAGTWDFNFLASSDRFFPARVKLIGLDYNTLHGNPQLEDAASRKQIRDVAAHRPVIPVIWAHHDDGNYIGRPYTPLAGFGSKLVDAGVSGFGIIHWMTRPLDLYFKSHAEQVWTGTLDRSLRATCNDIAERSFGAMSSGAMGDYLERWVKAAPNFGRETLDFFIDRKLTNIAETVTGCRERLNLLESLDEKTLNPQERGRLDYFKGLEEFIIAFLQTQEQFQKGQSALKESDFAAAGAHLTTCFPERVIRQFAKFSSLGGITRGEQGVLVSLNTRWLTHYVHLRQQLGLDSVRYAFGPTLHDPLAQCAGRFTFYFDEDHAVWERLGERETGGREFTLPGDAKISRGASTPSGYEEICRSGVESDKPLRLTLQPIMMTEANPDPLPAGNYRLHLLMIDPASTSSGQRVLDLKVSSVSSAWSERVDIFGRTGAVGRVLDLVCPVKLVAPGVVGVELTPVGGRATISGAVLEPAILRSK